MPDHRYAARRMGLIDATVHLTVVLHLPGSLRQLLPSSGCSLLPRHCTAGMLFEDTFEVTAVNPEGKKFDKGRTVTLTTSALTLPTPHSPPAAPASLPCILCLQ
jgi:hypothetical protein